jgi:murein DD-endopeptidase MepM/ murein hydrolase activator NlpD
MFVKTSLRLFRTILLLGILTLVIGYPAVAEQGSLSLYSYVMNTYNKEYVDVALAEEKLKSLQSQYQVIKQNNLQAESFEVLKEYSKKVEEDLNLKIDSEIKRLQHEQSQVAKDIESKLISATPKELSILNRKHSKFQEEIEDTLSDKTSITSLFSNPTYDRIDSSALELSIQNQKSIVEYNSNYNDTHLGEISELKLPFAYNRIVTSRAGYRVDPIDGTIKFHNATDYAMPEGTELYSLFNGTVVKSDYEEGGYGENIKIDSGNGIILHYAHLSKRYVQVGDPVNQNQFIGLSGDTGRSTGPHLHLSLFYKGEVLDIERLF